MSPGVNPELEIGRFLAEHRPTRTPRRSQAPSNTSPRTSGVTSTLAVMHRYVENQGDLWNATVEHLEPAGHRGNRPSRARRPNAATFPAMRMELLGRRVQSCTARSRSARRCGIRSRAGLAA